MYEKRTVPSSAIFYGQVNVMDDKQRIAKLEDEMDDVKVRLAVAESNIDEVKNDVSAIKDNTTWILRLVIGGLIGAVITFIVNGGLTQ